MIFQACLSARLDGVRVVVRWSDARGTRASTRGVCHSDTRQQMIHWSFARTSYTSLDLCCKHKENPFVLFVLFLSPGSSLALQLRYFS